MKKYIIAFAVIILIAAIAFTTLSNGKTKTVKAGGVLSVNDIQADPSAYKGTITINGVVAGISPQDPKLFAIIETLEAKTCKITGCAKFYLPVKFEGETPKVWDEVNVTGSFAEGKILVTATKVEVLRHLNFGGK
ncbi:MAG: hypothetical protein M1610_10170 [Nitrospirae bacterium]|nr:hypothetical protein [Nitrospirota bacterium]MDA8338025.1 hypothetical protein [Nitrospiraceae bacterium]